MNIVSTLDVKPILKEVYASSRKSNKKPSKSFSKIIKVVGGCTKCKSGCGCKRNK